MADARSPITTESATKQRTAIKSSSGFNSYPVWKRRLRENCYKRVRDDRSRLLWKMRSPDSLPDSKCLNHKELVRAAFQGIVSDELKRIQDSSITGCSDISDATREMKDMIWEYDGLPDSYEGDCEDILLEMQRIFYEDLRAEPNRAGTENLAASWEDEEDEYLAHSINEYMQLNAEQASKETWCPCCKQGKLKENHNLIYCNLCELKLRKSDEVTLEFLRCRLAEEHAEHLDRGCRSKPSFSIETVLDLTAVFITCSSCDTFEIVI